MKILITGSHDWGLAGALGKYLQQHEIEFASRSKGCDLITEMGRDILSDKSMFCDVFINCSKLDNFHQTLVLKRVWDRWRTNRKKGHIINIGSTVDTGLKGGSRLYTTEKVALRNFSRKLTYDSMSGNGIQVTYLSLGYLDIDGVSFKDKVKIKLDYVVSVIEWIITKPDYININEISIDPIQERNEKL